MSRGHQPTDPTLPPVPTTGSGVKRALRDEPDFVHTQRFELSYQQQLAAKDVQIAALVLLLREARPFIGWCGPSGDILTRIGAALEMSGGVL